MSPQVTAEKGKGKATATSNHSHSKGCSKTFPPPALKITKKCYWKSDGYRITEKLRYFELAPPPPPHPINYFKKWKFVVSMCFQKSDPGPWLQLLHWCMHLAQTYSPVLRPREDVHQLEVAHKKTLDVLRSARPHWSINSWMDQWINEKHGWMNERMNEYMNMWITQRINTWIKNRLSILFFA